MIVHGLHVNRWGGCHHYSTALDVVAIKFKCCLRYYACYECHLAMADHSPQAWAAEDHHTVAILCGRCATEMTIEQYMHCNHTCPNCKAEFNPHCRRHRPLYFSCT